MVGFYSGDPIDSPGVDAQGTNAIPATAGQVIGATATEAFEGGVTPRLLRQAERVSAPAAPVPDDPRIPTSFFGDPTASTASAPADPEAPKISAEQANAKYSIKGPTPDTSLTFNAPIPDAAAADLYNHQRAENLRQDTIARAQPGILTSAPARVVYGLAGGALDPSNIALAFLPGIGEANEARIAAAAGGGFIGRTVAGAASGAVAGATQMAALEPLNYALDQAEGKQWSMGEAARNIAWGTVLGGGLHVVGSVVRDALGREVPTDPIPAAIDRLDTEAQQQLVRGAVAQAMEDRPVDVGGALDLFQAKERAAQPDVAQAPEPETQSAAPVAETEAAPTAALPSAGTVEQPEAPAQPEDRSPVFDNAREPERLTSYVKRQGGVQDPSGDVRDIIGGAVGRPGLINQSGLPLDEMTEKAWQAGYFPEHGDQRPVINDLLDALDEDHNGYRPRYSDAEQDAANAFRQAQANNADVERMSNTYGIGTKGKTRQQFYAEVQAAAAREVSENTKPGLTLEETFDYRAADDAAAKQTPPKPAEALSKVQAHIADLEASMFPERAAAEEKEGLPSEGKDSDGAADVQPLAPIDPDVAAADALIDTAAKRAAGLDAIAACPGVIGA